MEFPSWVSQALARTLLHQVLGSAFCGMQHHNAMQLLCSQATQIKSKVSNTTSDDLICIICTEQTGHVASADAMACKLSGAMWEPPQSTPLNSRLATRRIITYIINAFLRTMPHLCHFLTIQTITGILF